MHNGNIIGAKRTFLYRAKISSLVEALGLNVQVKMGLDICKHASHLFKLRKAPAAIRNTIKGL